MSAPHYRAGKYCTIEQLTKILRQRGLRIDDFSRAQFLLETVGHYRLGPYYRAYCDYSRNTFHDGVSLDHVVALYALERRLRLLLLGPLEKIEVSMRSLIIKTMGDIAVSKEPSVSSVHIFDRRFYNLSNAHHEERYTSLIQHAHKCVQRRQKYLENCERNGQPFDQTLARVSVENWPAWSIIQCLSFGDISVMFSILDATIAIEVAKFFELRTPVMRNVLHSLTQLRNACAHHDTIFNSRFRSMKFPRRYADYANVRGVGSVYESCAMIHIILSVLSQSSTWYRRLKKLFNEYDCIDVSRMGFPEQWQTMPFWCVNDVRKIDERNKIREIGLGR